MRVLYVIDSLVPGGAERSLLSLAPCYRDRGVELEVAYLHDRAGLQDDLAEAGATLFSLAGRGGRSGWARRAVRLVRQRRPDLVHTTLFEADIAGRIAGWVTSVPVVTSLVNVQYGPEQLGDPRLKRWRLRGAQLVDGLTARRVVSFQAITAHVAEVMSSRLRVPAERIVVVPRGRDPRALGSRTQARRETARLSLGAGPETPLILAAARHEYQKGLDVLLDSMNGVLQSVPETRLVIAGRDGNHTNELKRRVESLGLENIVRFLGARRDVPDLMCAADTFVLPSRWEGLGSVLLEAMALEAPIVASALPAVQETVTEDHARLVPPERPDLTTQALCSALLEVDESRQRARRARARFLGNYTIESVADRMVAFYSDALARSGAASRVMKRPDDAAPTLKG